MKYPNYDVIYYNVRNDGRIELAGKEERTLSYEQAVKLSYTALVISKKLGFNGEPIGLFEGKHCQFDRHLGWVS